MNTQRRAKKSTAKKPTAKKAAAKKSTAKKTPAKKTAAQKSSESASTAESTDASSAKKPAQTSSATATKQSTTKRSTKKAAKQSTKKAEKKSSKKAKKSIKTAASKKKHETLVAAAVDAPRGVPIPAEWPGTLLGIDAGSTPGFEGDRKAGQKRLRKLDEPLDELQERLYAASRTDGTGRSVLLVVQGMDTSGKGGIMRHVVGAVDPQGVSITAFKAPTEEEKKHDFLWRIEPRVPAPGMIGVFDRSHYEDVLIHRVHGWADEAEIERRYAAINEFEKKLVDSGTTVIKVMLHISHQEQGERLMERLDRSDKHWKFNPGDTDEREHWAAYMDAYDKALRATSTAHAPWHVIPADRKWYARIAVQQLLLDALTAIDPQWPAADYDVEAERIRLRATMDHRIAD